MDVAGEFDQAALADPVWTWEAGRGGFRDLPDCILDLGCGLGTAR
jgi:hypothetical protein